MDTRLTSVTRSIVGMVFVCAAAAQLPRIGDIHVYGLHKISAGAVLSAAHLETGEVIPGSRGDLEGRIAGISGIAAVQVAPDCPVAHAGEAE